MFAIVSSFNKNQGDDTRVSLNQMFVGQFCTVRKA